MQFFRTPETGAFGFTRDLENFLRQNGYLFALKTPGLGLVDTNTFGLPFNDSYEARHKNSQDILEIEFKDLPGHPPDYSPGSNDETYRITVNLRKPWGRSQPILNFRQVETAGPNRETLKIKSTLLVRDPNSPLKPLVDKITQS